MRTVRTTIRPDRPIQVDDAEYTDLRRQGLLLDDEPTPAPDTAPAAKPRAQALTKKET